MAYGGHPDTDAADAVRALVGDTTVAAPKLDDATYTLILATEPRIYARAALACDALSGKYALEMKKRMGSLWREAHVLYEHYESLAKNYWLLSARRSKPTPFTGGVVVADVQTRQEDTTLVQPSFKVGMQDSIFIQAASLATSDSDGDGDDD